MSRANTVAIGVKNDVANDVKIIGSCPVQLSPISRLDAMQSAFMNSHDGSVPRFAESLLLNVERSRFCALDTLLVGDEPIFANQSLFLHTGTVRCLTFCCTQRHDSLSSAHTAADEETVVSEAAKEIERCMHDAEAARFIESPANYAQEAEQSLKRKASPPVDGHDETVRVSPDALRKLFDSRAEMFAVAAGTLETLCKLGNVPSVGKTVAALRTLSAVCREMSQDDNLPAGSWRQCRVVSERVRTECDDTANWQRIDQSTVATAAAAQFENVRVFPQNKISLVTATCEPCPAGAPIVTDDRLADGLEWPHWALIWSNLCSLQRGMVNHSHTNAHIDIELTHAVSRIVCERMITMSRDAAAYADVAPRRVYIGGGLHTYRHQYRPMLSTRRVSFEWRSLRANMIDADVCETELLISSAVLDALPFDVHGRAAALSNMALFAADTMLELDLREIQLVDSESGSLLFADEVAQSIISRSAAPHSTFASAHSAISLDFVFVLAKMLACRDFSCDTIRSLERELASSMHDIALGIRTGAGIRSEVDSQNELVGENARSICCGVDVELFGDDVDSTLTNTAAVIEESLPTLAFYDAYGGENAVLVYPRVKSLMERGVISREKFDSLKPQLGESTLAAFAVMLRDNSIGAARLGAHIVDQGRGGGGGTRTLGIDAMYYGEGSIGEGPTREITDTALAEYCAHVGARLCIDSATLMVDVAPEISAAALARPCEACRDQVLVPGKLQPCTLRTAEWGEDVLLNAAMAAVTSMVQSGRTGHYTIGPLLAAMFVGLPFCGINMAASFYALYRNKAATALARIADGEQSSVAHFSSLYRDNYNLLARFVPDIVTARAIQQSGEIGRDALMLLCNGAEMYEIVSAGSMAVSAQDTRFLRIALLTMIAGSVEALLTKSDPAATTGLLDRLTATLTSGHSALHRRTVVTGEEFTFSEGWKEYISERMWLMRDMARRRNRTHVNMDDTILQVRETIDELAAIGRRYQTVRHVYEFIVSCSREDLCDLLEALTAEKELRAIVVMRVRLHYYELVGIYDQLRFELDNLRNSGSSVQLEGGTLAAWAPRVRMDSVLLSLSTDVANCVSLDPNSTISVELAHTDCVPAPAAQLPLDSASTCDRKWKTSPRETYAQFCDQLGHLLAQCDTFTQQEDRILIEETS